MPARGSHCPKELDDWRDLGGDYCYYFETGKSVNFYEAIFDCKRRGKYILWNINIKKLHYSPKTIILHLIFTCSKKLYFQLATRLSELINANLHENYTDIITLNKHAN